MNQWKKILSQGKLIKAVSINDRVVTITLHDTYNHQENFPSIHLMFSNMWNLVPGFKQVFERVYNNNPLSLNLRDKNTYQTAQEALDAIIDFASTKGQVIQRERDTVEEVELREQKPPKKIIKPLKAATEKHSWKKLLSKGKLIQALNIQENHVSIQLFEKYDEKRFYKAINIMLKKLYDTSQKFQDTFRRPTIHTSRPYLTLVGSNKPLAGALLLKHLVTLTKECIGIGSKREDDTNKKKNIEVATVIHPVKEPAKPARPPIKLEDEYGIFKELLEEFPEVNDFDLPPLDIEEELPFLGYQFSHLIKIPKPVVNTEQKVPLIRFKLTGATKEKERVESLPMPQLMRK